MARIHGSTTREQVKQWLETTDPERVADTFTTLLAVFQAAQATQQLGETLVPPSDDVWRASFLAEELAVISCQNQVRDLKLNSLSAN